MCAETRWFDASALMSEISPASTDAATTLARWRAFAPGSSALAPAQPRSTGNNAAYPRRF